MSSPTPVILTPEGLSIPPGEKRALRSANARSVAAEEAFRHLVESVEDYAIFMLDPEGNIVTWNKGAERIKGYSSIEAIGRHFSMFYTPEDKNRNHPKNELAIAKGKGRYEEEGWRIRKDGSRFWANVVITALFDKDRELRGYSKVTRDLTERKQNEDQLKMSNEELERRVKERTEELHRAVQARDEFLSIASHELRTPLTPLKLQLQGIVLHLRNGTLLDLPPARLEKIGEALDRSLNRLGNLIESLLDVARINAGKIELHPEELKVDEVIRDTCSRFEHEAKIAGSTIKLELSPIRVVLDPLRLEQVVTNLTVNAIKYGNKKPIVVSAKKQKGRLLLQVKDKGIGIAPENFERIFNRFEQVGPHKASSGLGLGLYITKQIVDAQGGEIYVESEVGKGSTFFVELPINKR